MPVAACGRHFWRNTLLHLYKLFSFNSNINSFLVTISFKTDKKPYQAG